jgi:hypothetical protein
VTDALTKDDEYAGKALMRLATHWDIDPEDALTRAIDTALALEGFAELVRVSADNDRAFVMELRRRLQGYGANAYLGVPGADG